MDMTTTSSTTHERPDFLGDLTASAMVMPDGWIVEVRQTETIGWHVSAIDTTRTEIPFGLRVEGIPTEPHARTLAGLKARAKMEAKT